MYFNIQNIRRGSFLTSTQPGKDTARPILILPRQSTLKETPMNFSLSVIMFTLASFLLIPPTEAAVFTWKDGGGNSYSDVPKQLHPDQSQIVNLRTRQTRPAAKPVKPAAEKISTDMKEQEKDIAEKNRQIEEEKKKVAEFERQNKEENCRISKMNLKSVGSSKAKNRDDLIRKYNNDVNKYCR